MMDQPGGSPWRIISGGQTGVDRAALDAALDAGFDCGGWCPAGRKAEDGRIGDAYPLRELDSDDYAARTLKNVQDSDGTVIIYFGFLSGGTEKTLQFCLQENKPYLLIDADEVTASRAAARIAGFAQALAGKRINFAGPRASGEPRAYGFCRDAVDRFLQSG